MQNMDRLLDHVEDNRRLVIAIFNIIKSMELFISSIIYEFNIGPDYNMNIRLVPTINGISVIYGTEYDLNVFQWGPYMSAIIEKSRSRFSSRNHSHLIQGRFSRLQSYKVLIGKDCNHIKSLLLPSLQSYLVQ